MNNCTGNTNNVIVVASIWSRVGFIVNEHAILNSSISIVTIEIRIQHHAIYLF